MGMVMTRWNQDELYQPIVTKVIPTIHTDGSLWYWAYRDGSYVGRHQNREVAQVMADDGPE